jgi:hypothetical protein
VTIVVLDVFVIFPAYRYGAPLPVRQH